MDEFEQKKWFAYMGDHHEGPFSLAEIKQKMANGAVTPATYVWTEGMDDWKLMPEIPAFLSLFPMRVVQSTPPEAGISDIAHVERSPEELISERAQLIQEIQQVQEAPVLQVESQVDKSISSDFLSEPLATPSSDRKWRAIFLGILLMGSTLTVAYLNGYLEPLATHPIVVQTMKSLSESAQPYLRKLAEKHPAFAQWVSPIPYIDEVSPADYEELRSAAGAVLEKDGPKIAMAIAHGDPATPKVYVASNLPDGAVIQIQFEGVSDTLVGQLSVITNTEIVIQKKLGESVLVTLPENQPFPRGQYDVYAVDAEKQSEQVSLWLSKLQALEVKHPEGISHSIKLLATRSVFLGGDKDSVYAERLKEFHDKLQKKATEELEEIREFATTLESELLATTSKFKSLYRSTKTNPNSKKDWEAFHTEWLNFQLQMNKAFVKWTPEVLEKSFFYSELYKMIRQSQQDLEGVHNTQNAFFAGDVTDQNTFDIQLGQVSSVAESSIASLKAKIEQASKIPPTPNGMPRKDGL